MAALRLSLIVILLLFVCVDAHDAPGGDGKLLGQIIAYRPAEMIIQFASHVLNKQIYLFKVKEPQQEIVKLVYEHFGWAKEDVGLLSDLPLFLVSATRDKSCDETFEHFVKTSKGIISAETGADVAPPVAFIGNGDKDAIMANQLLPCYKVKEDGLHIVN